MDSLGQRVLAGLNVSLIGMTITIMTLFILSIAIIVLSKIVGALSAKKTGDPGMAGGSGGTGNNAVIGQTAVQAAAPPPDLTDDNTADNARIRGGELIAVLAAAIASATGASASSFRIVSYRRTKISVPVWNACGRNDYLSGKL